MVIVIIGILASMLLPLYSSFQTRSEETKCLANIRNLYLAASGYLNSQGSWPQIPVQDMNDNPSLYARAWVNALSSHGAPHSVWICPTVQKKMAVSMEDIEKEENYRIDFVPTPFDDNPATPRRAARFPWFMEKASSHSRGQLIILADGTTTTLADAVRDSSTTQ